MAVTEGRGEGSDDAAEAPGRSRRHERRLGVGALVLGLLLVLGARLAPGLGGPPLYDGIVPIPPYLWLAPGPGQRGGAQGATATVAVTRGQNGLVAVATAEMLPQAQVFAVPGSLSLPGGATTVSVSITPITVSAAPTDGVLASNVYRFDLVDQVGTAVTALPSGRVSVVLRSADAALANGIVERFDGTRWTPLTTPSPGANGAYLAIVTQFGDFAVVQPGAGASLGKATSGPVASGGSASSAPAAATSSAFVGPSPGNPASASPGLAAPPASATGSPPPVGAVVVGAIALIAVLAVALAFVRRGPGPPPPYRGAHRVERRR